MAKNDKHGHKPEDKNGAARVDENLPAENGPVLTVTGHEPAKVDAETGQISGDGFQEQAPPELENVFMPKRIVAKDIVGRAGLKCIKKVVAVIDEATGQPKKDGDNNVITRVEVTPEADLYMVFGTCSGTRTGTSQYGDWVSFTGNFEARRISDGAIFRSSECILQKPADALLLDALRTVKARDPSGSVNFAFTVGRRTSEKWVETGEGNSYEYTIKSQISVARHDPLAHLRNSLASALPKLAAPIPGA